MTPSFVMSPMDGSPGEGGTDGCRKGASPPMSPPRGSWRRLPPGLRLDSGPEACYNSAWSRGSQSAWTRHCQMAENRPFVSMVQPLGRYLRNRESHFYEPKRPD